MTDVQLSALAGQLFTLIRDLAGPGAILFLIVQSVISRRKTQDQRHNLRTQAEIDERRRSDELFNGMLTQFGRLGDEIKSLTSQFKESNQSFKEELKIQEETLAFRENQAIKDREDRRAETDKHHSAIREQSSFIAELTLGFTKGVDTLAKNQSDGVGEIARKIDEMGKQFANNLTPIDEKLSKLPQELLELRKSVDAIGSRIDEKLSAITVRNEEIKAERAASAVKDQRIAELIAERDVLKAERDSLAAQLAGKDRPQAAPGQPVAEGPAT